MDVITDFISTAWKYVSLVKICFSFRQLTRHYCILATKKASLLMKNAEVRIFLNPLSPSSDKNETSLYIITVWSNIQMLRIKETFTKDKMS